MWSKLVNTRVGDLAKSLYDRNGCQYHNWQHILDCYSYLEHNLVPYNEDLDYAVLYHDIVYDEHPDKEERSANALLLAYPDKKLAAEIVMATKTHSVEKQGNLGRWMIRADLHQLREPRKALENYVKIMNESLDLYGGDLRKFAKGNQDFMRNLWITIVGNHRLDPDPFWEEVMMGIQTTLAISHVFV